MSQASTRSSHDQPQASRPQWIPPSADEIRSLRKDALGLTQAEFAHVLWIHLQTVKQWEVGTRVPDAFAAMVLRLLADNPDRMLKAIKRIQSMS